LRKTLDIQSIPYLMSIKGSCPLSTRPFRAPPKQAL
jgi:hypothetical protein